MNIERRFFNSEVRAGESRVTGYGSVFESKSEDLGGFVEIIARGAFDDRLEDDVRALFNHDSSLILGRTKSGTLDLSIDDNGLRYEIDFPDTTYANDLQVSIKRGDIDQSSFSFLVEEDDFTEVDGTIVRTINKVSRLFDVSPVTYPAYPDATVGLRSLEQYIQRRDQNRNTQAKAKRMLEANLRSRQLTLAEISRVL